MGKSYKHYQYSVNLGHYSEYAFEISARTHLLSIQSCNPWQSRHPLFAKKQITPNVSQEKQSQHGIISIVLCLVLLFSQ